MRTFYRYLYDDKGRPIVTICTVEVECIDRADECVVFCRGIAICSPLDIKPQPDGRPARFSKKNGNRIARTRAKRAFKRQMSFKRIRKQGFEIAIKTPLVLMFLEERNLYKAGYQVCLDKEEAAYFNVLVLQNRPPDLWPDDLLEGVTKKGITKTSNRVGVL